MNLGFIGTGHITTAVVDGLCSTTQAPAKVLLSPRNADTAAALAKRHKQATVSRDNQSVVDDSDWIVLAVRPQVAREVVAALRFKPGQKIVSLIAPIADEWLDAAVAPGILLGRALPFPTVEKHIGPIAYHPRNAEVEALFAPLGTPLAIDDRDAFIATWSMSALIATHYNFIATAADWLARQGVPDETARAYVTGMIHALSAVADTPGAEAPLELAKHAQTPGGLNEQVVRELAAKGWFDQLGPALDGILKRLRGPR